MRCVMGPPSAAGPTTSGGTGPRDGSCPQARGHAVAAVVLHTAPAYPPPVLGARPGHRHARRDGRRRRGPDPTGLRESRSGLGPRRPRRPQARRAAPARRRSRRAPRPGSRCRTSTRSWSASGRGRSPACGSGWSPPPRSATRSTSPCTASARSTRSPPTPDGVDGPLVVATDARRREVYWAAYARRCPDLRPARRDARRAGRPDPRAGRGGGRGRLRGRDRPAGRVPGVTGARGTGRVRRRRAAGRRPARPARAAVPAPPGRRRARPAQAGPYRMTGPAVTLPPEVVIEALRVSRRRPVRRAGARCSSPATSRGAPARSGRSCARATPTWPPGSTASWSATAGSPWSAARPAPRRRSTRSASTRRTRAAGSAVPLLRGLLAAADALHATVFLEVRTDNEPARALYESEGFAVVGLRRRYYRPSGADAYTMRRERDGRRSSSGSRPPATRPASASSRRRRGRRGAARRRDRLLGRRARALRRRRARGRLPGAPAGDGAGRAPGAGRRPGCARATSTPSR